jgi:hypothetical protein
MKPIVLYMIYLNGKLSDEYWCPIPLGPGLCITTVGGGEEITIGRDWMIMT